MKKLLTGFLTILGVGFPLAVDSLLIPPPYHPCGNSPTHIPLDREYSLSSEYTPEFNKILSWVDHNEYHLTIRPEDTWKSLTQDIQKYQNEITIEKLIDQAYTQPRVLNLVPGEKLIYSDRRYRCLDSDIDTIVYFK
ncbi:MAG TPA: hypothetical protein VJG31_03600 [Candidatus Nanoarchaeia archaeon]|nr:hypothetical protein [Candidatus Nanoarchaeia archaeon]